MGSFPPVPLAPVGAYLESVRDAGCTVHALQDAVDGLGAKENLPSRFEVNVSDEGFFHLKHIGYLCMYILDLSFSVISSRTSFHFIHFSVSPISPALRIAGIAFNLYQVTR